MIIGLIGFGRVSKTLFNLIKSDDITFVTSSQNRSDKTSDEIRKSDIKVYDTFEEVINKSDIIISANSPKNALDVAKKYGGKFKGIYLDLNNISPQSTFQINDYVENLVDGAIIGKIESDNPVLYISGKKSDDILFLNEFIETVKISDNVGDAAVLKLLRSTYTKTLSAVLIESFEIAKENNLEEEFFNILTLTEGSEFKQKSLSRINNTLKDSRRKSEELEEIIKSFSNNDLTMVKAALKKLNR